MLVWSIIKNNQIRSSIQFLRVIIVLKHVISCNRSQDCSFPWINNSREIVDNCYKNTPSATSPSLLSDQFAAVPSLQAYSCFVMPRTVSCTKCSKTMAYKHLREHLASCVGEGRFCPICETQLNLEGIALTEHLISCGRKT